MSKFGDLIRGAGAPAPKAAPAPEPIEVESSPIVGEDETGYDELIEEELEETSPVVEALEALSKDELEVYGRELGIELDKRRSKSKLIEELHEAEKSAE